MSIDVGGYVNLQLYDAAPQTLTDRAITHGQVVFPNWRPAEGNTEVVLIESMALQVSELVYAVNRVPGAVTETLLRLFGLTVAGGAPPTATATFTVAASAAGQTVPAGTLLRMRVGAAAAPLDFRTNTDLVVAPNATTGTVGITGVENTTLGAGAPAGLVLQVVDAVPYVDSAALASTVSGGADPESSEAFLERGSARLQRLVTTLILPEHFTAAAAEQPYVTRAYTIDSFSPFGLVAPTNVAAAEVAGGTLPVGTYSYRVAATNADGETQASAAVAVTTAAVGTVRLTWTATANVAGVAALDGYRIYGRTAGGERLLGTVGAAATSFDDTGAATPGADTPLVTNSTGGAPGSRTGHVSVAVAGPDGAPVAAADKAALDTALEAQAFAALNIHIVDAQVNTQDVAVTVVREPTALAADVSTAVEAALRSYLNPNVWPFAGRVFRNELVSLLDAVPGVARVGEITPAGDVTLRGVAPLVKAGTVAVTVQAP